MKTLSKTGLASTLAFFAGLTAATAQEQTVDVLVNNDMNADLYRIAEDWNIPGTSTVTRARHDRAAEVYCQWEISADIDAQSNVSNIQVADQFCRAAETSDTDQWTIDDVDSMYDVMHNQRYIVEPDAAANIVVERAPNGPNPETGVFSEYRRVWDFNAGTVCLSAFEGQNGETPYIQQNHGCHGIPDNDHVAGLRATLDM